LILQLVVSNGAMLRYSWTRLHSILSSDALRFSLLIV
jgi:hypothetical protein